MKRELLVALRFPKCGKSQTRDYGCSASAFSSFANGALGERRRHESYGIRLEIGAAGAGADDGGLTPEPSTRGDVDIT